MREARSLFSLFLIRSRAAAAAAARQASERMAAIIAILHLRRARLYTTFTLWEIERVFDLPRRTCARALARFLIFIFLRALALTALWMSESEFNCVFVFAALWRAYFTQMRDTYREICIISSDDGKRTMEGKSVNGLLD